MQPFCLLAWAVCTTALLTSNALAAITTPATPTATSSNIIKQINRVNDDGSYTIGYEAADGTFKIETRDVYGNVKGMFGFIDSTGHVKRVAYTTANSTERNPLEDLNSVPDFKTSSNKRPTYIRMRARTPPHTSSMLKYRRPIPDTESPEDESPVFAMLLRRSRQGLPTRSDADELLRLQQSDSSDIYGGTAGGSYQVPEVPFRQHFLQNGRGRVNNAVLQHHLRQLSPDQLIELQQYAANAAAQSVPDPIYASPTVPPSRYPVVRSAVNPLLQYLASSSATKDAYDQTYPTRYPYTPASVSHQPPYFYPPIHTPYYPSQTYGGFNGLTSARSYPFQNPNLPEELRQALIYRMLQAAKLLGLDGLVTPKYGLYNDNLRLDPYFDEPRYPTRYGTGSSYSLDPYKGHYGSRYLQDPAAYSQAAAYYSTLALARAAHARQLAAYQQSIAQDHRSPVYSRTGYTVPDIPDDPAIIELRKQFGDPTVQYQPTRLAPNPVVYRGGIPDSTTGDDADYGGHVTPSPGPSVSSTTVRNSGSTRAPPDRTAVPSYIQRVRSVQVLNSASASPSRVVPSSTTRRPPLAA